jgi:hydrogenase expression/formation protein HypC
LAVPGRVIETYREHDVLMGRVDFGGAIKRACLECVRDAQPGDYVLVHVGFALTRMDEAEAQRVWRLLEELGEAEDEGAQIRNPKHEIRNKHEARMTE